MLDPDISANHPNWVDLKIINGLANTDEDITRNIESSIKLGLPSLNTIWKKQTLQMGPAAIVGSGPSLKETWKQLKDFKGDIFACNAACQFLLDKGIVPKYMMCFDADPLMLEFLTPHPDITYLIGSRCPPQAFEILKECNIILWHAGGDRNIDKILHKNGMLDEPMVGGGTAAVTRCLYLVPWLGYKELHVFGGDSSFANGETHIRKSTTEERRIPIKCAGRVFWTAPWMTTQIEDFKTLAPDLRDFYGVRIIMHGDGYMQHVAKTMFFEGDGQGPFLCWLKKWRNNARVLWQFA